MGTLDPFKYNPSENLYGSISNECTPVKSATGEYEYDLHIKFHAPYFHDDNCNEIDFIFASHPMDPTPKAPITLPRT
jgi:hypothetical protein